MKFSTKVIEKMAEIMAEEMGNQISNPQDIREVETGMRELLQKVGAEGSTVVGTNGWGQTARGEIDCECAGKWRYLFRREAVILSVFGRVSYKRRYYACPECGSGRCPLDQRMQLAVGEVTSGLADYWPWRGSKWPLQINLVGRAFLVISGQ